jgi:hypothetical protein
MTQLSRISLADNIPLTQQEYKTCQSICTIITQLAGNVSVPNGGIFWDDADKYGPFTICHRADYHELNVMLLLNTRFRDYPSLVYAYEELTPEPDYWVKRYIHLNHTMPERWKVKIPAKLGEVGFDIGGYPVNRCIGIVQERVAAMLLLGAFSSLERSDAPRALEIGGGAGEMGAVICRAVPDVTYYNCDLPYSQAFNMMRLSVLFPHKRHLMYVGNQTLEGVDESLIIRSPEEAARVKNAVVNIPHYLLDDFKGHLDIDLACNTWSFAEMPESEVTRYGMLIKGFLKAGGALFEQNEQIADRNGVSTEAVFAPLFPVCRYANRRWWDVLTIRIMSGSSRVWRKQKPALSCKAIWNYVRYRWMLRNGLGLFAGRKQQFDPTHWQRLSDIFGQSSPALSNYEGGSAKAHVPKARAS